MQATVEKEPSLMATKGSVYLASAALAARSSGDIGVFASAACARETFGKTTSSVETTTSDNRNIGRKRILAPLEGAQVCSWPDGPSTQTSCSGVRLSCSISSLLQSPPPPILAHASANR